MSQYERQYFLRSLKCEKEMQLSLSTSGSRWMKVGARATGLWEVVRVRDAARGAELLEMERGGG